MSAVVRIAGRDVAMGRTCVIIAEAGVNHNGNLDLARRLVAEASAAGADAVKFQTFSADLLATRDAPKAAYQRAAGDACESQFEMLRRLELSPQAHRTLLEDCRRRGILFLSSVFDERSADLLETLDAAAYKIPSGELTNLPLIEHVARKGRPLIISTGMATLDEVAAAVAACVGTGNTQVVLLHCVSSYPARPADANLRAMETMARAFGLPVGYSDHTTGNAVALAAVALGAAVLEKHFTLDRTLPGPDHRASLEPPELRGLIADVRAVERARGNGEKRPVEAEMAIAAVARKSLVAARDIAAGTVLTPELVVARRPGTGLSPSRRGEVLGRRAARDIAAGTLLRPEMLA